MLDPDTERDEEEAAAAGAAAIGGSVSEDPDADLDIDPAERPLSEAGQGEAEGFELAEQELRERASHEDQHGLSRVGQDAEGFTEDARAAESGEADQPKSSASDD